ncbi:MAG: hypothetical protein HY822_05165 [Acidobacteria bacterium]|nr:hypothetical protein [Acidobacteriota bacterium]
MKRVRWMAVLSLALPLWCQPRAPEAFGQIGYGMAEADDGSLGKGVVFGGALTVPFAARWAVDIDVHHQRAARNSKTGNTFGVRRTLAIPAILYRRGSNRLYWFGGGGAGGRLDRMFDRMPNQPEFKTSQNGVAYGGRTGVVAAATDRLLARVDFYWVHTHVAPDVGVKIGIGYRF